MRIDAHQHYRFSPFKDRERTEFMPNQLKPLLAKHQFQYSVAVQTLQSMDDTRFLLALAEEEPTIAGVVGWVDLEGGDFTQHWRYLQDQPKLVGIRPMIQNLDSDWILKEIVLERLSIVCEAGLPVDLQANPRHLPYIVDMLKKLPELTAVVDHLAKPPISEQLLDPWRIHMQEIAEFPNVMCKLSGMVPSKPDAAWSYEAIRPYAACVIQAFEPERVMFGSDWPVCLRSAEYDEVIALHEFCTTGLLNSKQRQAVYGENAIRFYQLDVN